MGTIKFTEESAGMANKHSDKGLIFVHTGNGKGKTTAALGLVLRAVGHGRRVFVAQFMKSEQYGEIKAIKDYLPNVTIAQFGRNTFISKDNLSPVDVEMAVKGLEKARKAVMSDKYDLVILDEINVAIYSNLIPLKDVLELIKSKPERLDLGLTGRYAPQEIIDIADLVTEMKEIKHPYAKGIPAKKGFEF
ncbi:MAG: cob(I)yrinic acid a,c-diamide adenosyltransferase [Syntrophomonadaceae bacterium]|jgi:cob(I)alamin adenosyltransferase